MTAESLIWFAGQAVLVVIAVVFGSRITRTSTAVWKAVALGAVATMLCWPLMRVFPAFSRQVFGTIFVVFAEVTGIVIPTALFFTIAAAQVRRPSERRAVCLLVAVCGLYFVKSGFWMLGRPVPEFQTIVCSDGVCRQSTSYTCVAASLVTLLKAHGIATTETEMARSSYTEVNGGTTDSRALLALERKLAGRPLDICYSRMDYARLQQVDLPCLVPLKWGYYCSHMVPVLIAGKDEVVLGDPLTGPRSVSRVAFERKWLGRAIYLRNR